MLMPLILWFQFWFVKNVISSGTALYRHTSLLFEIFVYSVGSEVSFHTWIYISVKPVLELLLDFLSAFCFFPNVSYLGV